MARLLHACLILAFGLTIVLSCAPQPAAPRQLTPTPGPPMAKPSPSGAPTSAATPIETPTPRATVAGLLDTPSAVSVPTTPAGVAGACGNLKIAFGKPLTTLNPHLAPSAQDYDAARLVLEPLAAFNPRGEAVPVLAAEIPSVANSGVTTDFLTVTWKLKPGVTWSDGSEFTADDVVFTYRYVTNPLTGSADRAAFDNVLFVAALDKYTIRVRWREATQQPLEGFTGASGLILQRRQFERYTGDKSRDGPNLRPVGTGPYMVNEAKPGDRFTYDLNPLYRDRARGKPCFGSVSLTSAPDPVSAAREALVTGQADYSAYLPIEPVALATLAGVSDAKGVLITQPGASVERLLFNRTNPDPALGDYRSELPERGGEAHPFLSDVRVRRALALVIDRTALVSQLYGPAATPTCRALNAPPAFLAAAVPCPPVDASVWSTATALLDDAGWLVGSNGVRHKIVKGQDLRMRVLFQTSANPLRANAQALIKAAWERLGVDVTLRTVPPSVFFASSEFNADAAGRFYADVEMLAGGPDSPDPANFLKTWTCAEIRTRSSQWSGNNFERACSREYDRLFSMLTHEMDPARRIELALRMQDVLLGDVFWTPLFVRNTVAARSRTLAGVDLNGIWDSELWNVAEWRR